MTVFKILQQLKDTSGKKLKREILKANVSNKELSDLLNATFNYKRRFYMKKWPPGAPGIGATHEQFMELLRKLEDREITGHASVEATAAFFAKCPGNEKDWYGRVLKQDLKIGVSAETAIECGFDIPMFDVRLAAPGEKCKRVPELLKKGCLASPKFDGYRCIALIDNGDVILYSRNGTVFDNFPQIQEALAARFPNEQLVLDGEIMSNDFNAMQKTAFAYKRKTTVGDVAFHIFDLIPFVEWTTDQFKLTYDKRVVNLAKLFKEKLSDSPAFQLVKQTPIKTFEEIKELEKQYIEQGFEGVMINPPLPYYRGRKTNAMLKFKLMKSMDCKVIGFYEGEDDTRHKGSLGGCIVLQENGEKCRVGGGFSDEEREWIWNNKNTVLNSVMEVKYQELTGDNIMRFPTKFRWRGDKEYGQSDS